MAYIDVTNMFYGILLESRTADKARDKRLKRLMDSCESLEWTEENIDRFESPDNLLRHARPEAEGFILAKGDKLVGYAAWDGRWLVAFEVAEPYRRMGVGKRMLSRARRNGADRLTVSKDNLPAIMLYMRSGFRITAVRDRMYEMRHP